MESALQHERLAHLTFKNMWSGQKVIHTFHCRDYSVNIQTTSDSQSHKHESIALVNVNYTVKFPPKQKPTKFNCLVNIVTNTNAIAIA